jgi:hypothetical protein
MNLKVTFQEPDGFPAKMYCLWEDGVNTRCYGFVQDMKNFLEKTFPDQPVTWDIPESLPR